MANIDFAERMKIIAARMNAGMDTYAGRLDAWHQLGSVTGSFMTWKEMVIAAKADFTVLKQQLEWKGTPIAAWGTFRIDTAIPQGLGDKVIRLNTNAGEIYAYFLGAVGEAYEPIQHTEGFELMDTLVSEMDGNAHYETMGTLDFGRIVWGQINPNFKIRVGEDESDIYVTFNTSHDGSMAFEVFETGGRSLPLLARPAGHCALGLRRSVRRAGQR